MVNPDDITHQTALDVFRVAFIRRVGVGRHRMSYGDLSDATGIQVRTLKSWHDGQAMPHLDNWLKLCVVFGTDFTSETLRVINQGGVDSLEVAEVNVTGTLDDLVDTAHEITLRLRDGVFDHVDRIETAPLLLKLSRALEEQAHSMIDKGASL